MSAEKVLAAAVAKSEELGVKVFFRLEITTNRYFCFAFTTLRLYMDTIHSFYQKIFYSKENGVKVFFYGTMMYADRDGFLDLQNQIISR